jgi:acetyl esterase/lipase
VRYADHDEAVIDLHLPGGSLPEGEDTPLLLLVHGGFWKAEWDRTHTRAMARALADDGWVVATPEYRRVRGGGGWPTTGDDVRRALDALPALLTGLGVQTGRTVATGHSAGGQLVLWLAATGAALDRVVALAPVCDLGEAIRLHLGEDATQALLGDLDPDPADPAVLLERGTPMPVSIVHGSEDDIVPVALSRGLVARHPWVELAEVPGDHFAVIQPDAPAWTTVLAHLHRS